MNVNVVIILALVAGVPTALSGIPKDHCETSAAETRVHRYGSFLGYSALGPPVDGAATRDCGRSEPGDGHAEYAQGGAYLLVSDPMATRCYGYPAHHAAEGWVSVHEYFDQYLDYGPIHMAIYSDTVNNVPPVDPNEPNCGDGIADVGIHCLQFCPTYGLQPGLDGAFLVFVRGAAGDVYA